MARLRLLLLTFALVLAVVGATRLSSVKSSGGGEEDTVGTRWAVLVAGSSGYENYRHQADVCHAYQIMKKGGLKDENIIVFMYDDIAHNPANPRPGVIINKPKGHDVYAGVSKDYTGDNVTVNNFLAVLRGNRSALTGGSGKVVDSGPKDHIFVFYSDHGGPGVLGMPTNPPLYANDLVQALEQKHAAGTYKSLVFYIESCESGSIFDGLLPDNINIYATTAANATENSWATYCPGMNPSPPRGYHTCLGDLYSVSWMENSDWHDLRTESLEQQYELVKDRTSVMSHVTQYGDLALSVQSLFLYMGTNPANNNHTFFKDGSLPSFSRNVDQRAADLVYFWQKYLKVAEGSSEKSDARKQLVEVMAHRFHVDSSVAVIGKLLFGSEDGSRILNAVRPAGQPLVHDWGCLKSMVRAYEARCGTLAQYGMKHMRAFANICNAGIHVEAMAKVASQACPSIPSNPWSSISKGFSA